MHHHYLVDSCRCVQENKSFSPEPSIIAFYYVSALNLCALNLVRTIILITAWWYLILRNLIQIAHDLIGYALCAYLNNQHFHKKIQEFHKLENGKCI